MKIRKDMIFAVLTTFCMSALMFAVIPIRSGLPYDPWADITGVDGVPDDKIDMRDIGKVAASFGTLNTDNLTRNVNVTNWPAEQNTVNHNDAYYWGAWIEGFAPGQSYSFSNTTKGYSEMTLAIDNWGRHILVRVSTLTNVETWEIGQMQGERVSRTFPLDGGDYVWVSIENIDTYDADVGLGVSMSTWNSQTTISRKYGSSSEWGLNLSSWQQCVLRSSVAGYDRFTVYVVVWSINVTVTIVGTIEGMNYGWPYLDSFNITSTQQATQRIYQVNCEKIAVVVTNIGSTRGDCLILFYKTA